MQILLVLIRLQISVIYEGTFYVLRTTSKLIASKKNRNKYLHYCWSDAICLRRRHLCLLSVDPEGAFVTCR